MFKEIRNQPEHIREIFMWLCVVIVFSLVLLAGVRQTEKRLVALLNPELQEDRVTEIAKEAEPPFASLADYFGELRASIADIFDFNFAGSVQEIGNEKIEPETPGALLPLAGEK